MYEPSRSCYPTNWITWSITIVLNDLQKAKIKVLQAQPTKRMRIFTKLVMLGTSNFYLVCNLLQYSNFLGAPKQKLKRWKTGAISSTWRVKTEKRTQCLGQAGDSSRRYEDELTPTTMHREKIFKHHFSVVWDDDKRFQFSRVNLGHTCHKNQKRF